MSDNQFVLDVSTDEFLAAIKTLNKPEDMLRGCFGLEKEGVRVDEQGHMVTTPHPAAFGNKARNSLITTDFAESQVELITPVLDSIPAAVDSMTNLHDVASLTLAEQGEYLWPQSMPPILPDEEDIKPANFGEDDKGKASTTYRKYLVSKYGKRRQMISGTHFNVSIALDVVEQLRIALAPEVESNEFRSALYLRLARGFSRNSFVVPYVLGASGVFHPSYLFASDGSQLLDAPSGAGEIAPETWGKCGMASMRNSDFGYRNFENFFVDFNTLEGRRASLQDAIDKGVIAAPREYYGPLRLKAEPGNDVNTAVDYVEVRAVDLNPFTRTGIDIDDLYFIHGFLIYCLITGGPRLEEAEFLASTEKMALSSISRDNVEETRNISVKFLRLMKDAHITGDNYVDAVNRIAGRWCASEFTNAQTRCARLYKAVSDQGFIGYHMSLAREYLEISRQHAYSFTGHEDMELSSQVLMMAALRRGVNVEVLDSAANFIYLERDGHGEYVKQATKTSADTYISSLIMEDKQVTKVALERAGIRTPQGKTYYSPADIFADSHKFKGRSIVVKPKTTNFGIGITVLPKGFYQSDLAVAVDLAFANDTSVIVEEFIKGLEYRFLVIGNEVRAVMHRVGASVVGDGIHTIEELVEIENRNPLRGHHYERPLQQIKLGDIETTVLGSQSLMPSSIAPEGQRVMLRENSNISTGGVGIDYTDLVDPRFKQVAVEAAHSVGANICGVDLITEDYADADKEYAIIELNFNPALHIHDFPYEGKNRHTEEYVLDLLGFEIR